MTIRTKIGLGLVVALLAWIGVLQLRLAHEQRLRDRISFYSDSVIAAKDTTHLADLSELSKRELERLKLGDSIQVVQRLAIQTKLERDALDRALRVETRARLGLVATVDSLRMVVTTPGPVVETPEGVRSATFDVDSVPFRGTVDVSLPRPPAAGRLNLRIGVIPAPVSLRVSCGAAPPGSTVRPAVVTATGPSWLTMTLGELEQDPATCNQKTLDLGSSRGLKVGVGCAVGPSVALVSGVVHATYIGASCGLTIRP